MSVNSALRRSVRVTVNVRAAAMIHVPAVYFLFFGRRFLFSSVTRRHPAGPNVGRGVTLTMYRYASRERAARKYPVAAAQLHVIADKDAATVVRGVD